MFQSENASASATSGSCSLEHSEQPARVLKWLVGIPAYNAFSWLYDYLFFSFILWKLGALWGSLILTATTALIDYLSLRAYDSSKEDWLALEYLKSLEFYSGRNFLKRVFGWLLRETPPFVKIVVLTPKSNAFLTTALLRKGPYSYATMTRRDWNVFWFSFLCSQLYWITLVSLGIEGLSEIFPIILN